MSDEPEPDDSWESLLWFACSDDAVDSPERPRDRQDVALMKAKAALHEAVMQILYLHDKFQPTGTGTATIAHIERALTDIDELLK